MKLQGTMSVKNNNLSIGGVSLKTLNETYGTPLYIVDQAEVEKKCRLFKNNFKHENLNGIVAYASKAFLCQGMAQIVAKEGLSMDVVSGGELYTAYKAGFPMEKLYFHGNNKSKDELVMAIEFKCGNIILDNRNEAILLSQLLREYDHTVNVFLRVNPGIYADTHKYIMTSTNTSKFGESIYSDEIFEILKNIYEDNHMNFKGLHCHIGSQIFQEEFFFKTVTKMLSFYKVLNEKTGINFESINFGGGFGAYYTEKDRPINLAPFLKKLMDKIYMKSKSNRLNIKTAIIEPGRSIINSAGSTLYTIGGTKNTYGGKAYIFVNGGMSDNLRPALYQAKYEAAIDGKVNESKNTLYTIAGKLCESGDVLIENILLPKAYMGELLLISSTGAYNFSMSSNYNKMTRPAVVLVKDGTHRLMVRRQSYNDLLYLDEKI